MRSSIINKSISINKIFLSYEIPYDNNCDEIKNLYHTLSNIMNGTISKYFIVQWISNSGLEQIEVLIGLKSSLHLNNDLSQITDYFTYDKLYKPNCTIIPNESEWNNTCESLFERLTTYHCNESDRRIITNFNNNLVSKIFDMENIETPMMATPQNKNSNRITPPKSFHGTFQDMDFLEGHPPKTFSDTVSWRTKTYEKEKKLPIIPQPSISTYKKYSTEYIDDGHFPIRGTMFNLLYREGHIFNIFNAISKMDNIIDYSIGLNDNTKNVYALIVFKDEVEIKSPKFFDIDAQARWIKVDGSEHLINAKNAQGNNSLPIVKFCNNPVTIQCRSDPNNFNNIYNAYNSTKVAPSIKGTPKEYDWKQQKPTYNKNQYKQKTIKSFTQATVDIVNKDTMQMIFKIHKS